MFLIYTLLICLIVYASPLLGTFFFYIDSRFHDDLDKAMELRHAKKSRASHTTSPYTLHILKHRRGRRLPQVA